MVGALQHALMITGFVFVMMLVVEYVNVLTQGSWQEAVTRRKWGQYLLAAGLGAMPGCLGAFAVVAMYSHGAISLGAVVATMIATSGDESFVMLAIIPKMALAIFAVLFVLGIVSGALTDALFAPKKLRIEPSNHSLELHDEPTCECFPRGRILQQWRECSASRGILSTVLGIFVLSLILGWVGPPAWNWIRVTILLVSVIGLFIVLTVPDHFLHEHLWEHVARRHVPRIFAWTYAALLVMVVLTQHLHLEESMQQGHWIILLFACLVGLIPESGPHLIFVTLYAQGSIPFSILLASSIVQDGHGMLPVLADSRRQFVVIKSVNFVVGAVVGALLMALEQ